MIPISDLEGIIRRASFYGREHPLHDRLVSVLFALPASLPMRTLKDARVCWDAETGDSRDLFFAGYHPDRAWTNTERETRLIHRSGGNWWFDPASQVELADTIGAEHARAMSAAGGRSSWTRSGNVDLVSFMVYGQEPDWLSLKSVAITGSRGEYIDRLSLGEVVEGSDHGEMTKFGRISRPASPIGSIMLVLGG